MTGLRRVVVTGVGMVSPLGAGVENVWRRLLNSESGIATIEGFDAIEEVEGKYADALRVNADQAQELEGARAAREWRPR